MTYRQGRVHPQVLQPAHVQPPSESWWLDPAFQRGERSQAQCQAEARMQADRVSTPGERRTLDTRFGKV